MKQTNRICEILGTRYPIIQAPMSWLTDARFVAAVSNAGGLGFLAPHAGQTTNPCSNEEVLARLQEQIRKVKALTDKPFGVPVVLSYDLAMIEPISDLLIAEQVPVALINYFEGYDFEPIIAKLKNAGLKILFRPLNPTLENARFAEKVGADIFISTGFDEGGTLPTQQIGSFSVVSHIVDEISIPVMLAGGIADVRGVRAALALGAEGVYVGTAFLATVENRMADNVKQLLVSTTANDLHIYRTNPAYYRSIPTALSTQLVAMDAQGASRDEIEKASKFGTGMRLGMLEGNLDEGYISVGNGVTLIKEIRSVQALIDDLMQDFR
ncbi:enoyl-[acyl-carrier protein] reductase II [Moraxella cuniculi DSM 21768]|uniref:Enoyl-[acyl-carrier protein] reductase II n=1 Tax=Moraxella cuniculi DSM 21768 TaxID=1122245 RepID=A0A1N7EYY1_9GAMM|nr:nitronate monooxygenase [Moraxella cuniculi]OOS02289.1 diguanylate cyclase [Moraxella cuniculi]SIR93299.1 enoyl-[acyl-carrier protein] reductase II [Moraxella cuniculi DSM 21768]